MAAGPSEERRSLSQGQVEEEDERGGGAPPGALRGIRGWAPPSLFRGVIGLAPPSSLRGVIGSSTIAVMSKMAWQTGSRRRRGRRMMMLKL